MKQANFKPFERKSSNLKGYKYNTKTERLTIEFTSGDRYSYDHVPADVVAALLTAESHGSFFYQHIRDNSSYPASKATK